MLKTAKPRTHQIITVLLFPIPYQKRGRNATRICRLFLPALHHFPSLDGLKERLNNIVGLLGGVGLGLGHVEIEIARSFLRIGRWGPSRHKDDPGLGPGAPEVVLTEPLVHLAVA